MSRVSPVRWRRRLWLPGLLLILGGAILLVADRLHADLTTRLQQADTLYRTRQYRDALAAYTALRHRLVEPPARASTWVLGRLTRRGHLALQIANCRYRLAEALLQQYQQTARGAQPSPRPSLEAVQRLLTQAHQAYGDVPQDDPRVALAARVNRVRVAAWQLLLATFHEATSGQRSLRQQAVHAIRQAADAVDYALRHQDRLPRHDRLMAMLLLETLTAFSQERPAPVSTRPPRQGAQGRLGDLLLRTQPELTSSERRRFQNFFFALPFEARDPWPRQGGAGGGRAAVTH